MSATCCKLCSCLLLWTVQCTGGKLSLKNDCPGWRMSQVDQRFFFFLTPATFHSPSHTHSEYPSDEGVWYSCSFQQSPVIPLGAEGSQWNKGQTNSEQCRYRFFGHSPEWTDSGTSRAECSRPLLSNLSPPSSLPRGYEKICLRLYSEDKHFKKEIIT